MSAPHNGKIKPRLLEKQDKTGNAAPGEASGKMQIHKAFKYRIYPNATQQHKLDVQFGHARYIYNWGLTQSQDGYPGYTRLTKQLTILKASEDTAWLKAGHSQVLQQALKNLDRAFEHFFDRWAGYPQFKSKRARQSIRYPQPNRTGLHRMGGRSTFRRSDMYEWSCTVRWQVR